MTLIDRWVRALTTTMIAIFAVLLLANAARMRDPIVFVFALIFGIGAGALMLVPRDGDD